MVGNRHPLKRGWRKIAKNRYEMDIGMRLRRITQDPSFSESVKEQAHKFLSTVLDEKMPTLIYEKARIFIRENKIPNQTERRKIRLTESAESHAVFLACQACDNLRDRTIKINSGHEKAKMAAQIASAINALSELQIRLMGGNDDDQEQG
jgi:hypothetical protein